MSTRKDKTPIALASLAAALLLASCSDAFDISDRQEKTAAGLATAEGWELGLPEPIAQSRAIDREALDVQLSIDGQVLSPSREDGAFVVSGTVPQGQALAVEVIWIEQYEGGALEIAVWNGEMGPLDANETITLDPADYDTAVFDADEDGISNLDERDIGSDPRDPTDLGMADVVSLGDFRLLNRWLGTYLYDEGDRAGYGDVTDASAVWEQLVVGDYVAFRNRQTGDFLHLEEDEDYAQAAGGDVSFHSAQWTLEPYEGYQRFRNRFKGELYLNTELQLGYAQATAELFEGSESTHWTLQPVGVEPGAPLEEPATQPGDEPGEALAEAPADAQPVAQADPGTTEPAPEPVAAPADTPADEPAGEPAGQPTAEPAADADEPASVACSAPPETFRDAMLSEMNRIRSTDQRCDTDVLRATTPLKWNEQLGEAARSHSVDIATNNLGGAIGSDGFRVEDTAIELGYPNGIVSGVGSGFVSVAEAVDAIVDNREFCRDLMDPDFFEVGVACATNTEADLQHYWTILYGLRP